VLPVGGVVGCSSYTRARDSETELYRRGLALAVRPADPLDEELSLVW
jgi:hypothetical protein